MVANSGGRLLWREIGLGWRQSRAAILRKLLARGHQLGFKLAKADLFPKHRVTASSKTLSSIELWQWYSQHYFEVMLLISLEADLLQVCPARSLLVVVMIACVAYISELAEIRRQFLLRDDPAHAGHAQFARIWLQDTELGFAIHVLVGLSIFLHLHRGQMCFHCNLLVGLLLFALLLAAVVPD